ncbi:MAG: tRNA wybutosine-synthesizing protein 3 [Candidatus Diapherotrites archaeon]|nr:tRNA wybutosine-synthesizing protein 3 [Candidatus Diapherotrites archaeon]
MDAPIVPLLDLLNANTHYVTTSSCSGRVVLLATTPSEKKGESFFYRKWHRPVIFDEVWGAISSFSGSVLWFKVDPFIIHVGADSFESALRLVNVAHRAGVKIAGIQAADNVKFHVEIRGIDYMAVPVYERELLVNKDYVRHLVRIANRKMVRNAHRLARLFKAVSTLL